MSNVVKLLVIAGVEITTDTEGRFNLNSLHKASGGEKKNGPAYWLALGSTEMLIDEIKKLNTEISVFTARGKNGGTFAVEQLAVAYANWISPAFYLQVIDTFLNYKKGNFNPEELTRLDILQLAMESEKENLLLKEQISEDKPKVTFFDEFVNRDGLYGLYGLQNAARALHQPPNKFIQGLKQSYLFYKGGALVAKARYIHQGLFETKTTIVDDKIRPRTFITPKGLQYFASKAESTGQLAL